MEFPHLITLNNKPFIIDYKDSNIILYVKSIYIINIVSEKLEELTNDYSSIINNNTINPSYESLGEFITLTKKITDNHEVIVEEIINIITKESNNIDPEINELVTKSLTIDDQYGHITTEYSQLINELTETIDEVIICNNKLVSINPHDNNSIDLDELKKFNKLSLEKKDEIESKIKFTNIPL